MRLRLLLAVLVLVATACSSGAPTSEPALDIQAAASLAMVPAFSVCGAQEPSRGICDPINLVFPDAGFATITASLIAAGWSVVGIGAMETVLEPGTSEVLQPAVQLFETEGQGIASARFHVRLWQLANGDTVGAVHHETGGIEHRIDLDWEAAEDRVVRDLCTGRAVCSDGEVIVDQQRQQHDTDRWRGFRNDWRPAVILLTQPG